MRNISACFPELPENRVRNMACRHFRHMAMALFTMSVAWWSSRRRLERLARFRHRDYLDNCLQAGRNVILLVPHFTSLEILGITLFSQYPMTSMYQRHHNPFMDRLIRQKRGRFGTVLFPQKSSLKPLVKSIRSGIPFYYLPDQDPGHSRGVFVPFFGIQAATHASLGKLAEIGDAVVIPCMATVSRYGTRLDIVFNPPLENFPTGDRESDAAAMNRTIEELVLLAPEQYFWSHKRFKTRPPGEPPFYR